MLTLLAIDNHNEAPKVTKDITNPTIASIPLTIPAADPPILAWAIFWKYSSKLSASENDKSADCSWFVDVSDPNKQIRTIKHVKRHPYFDIKFKFDNDDAVFENDIAVLELDTPFTFGPKCNKLPYSTSKNVVDKNSCRISGWGGIDINGELL
ncbi:unnamed protein product [Mytilus coruscus]|uniref:Peptidase S1 domain-containing protein n=1 Tax=Mytilus coruscus TaxID=42192 RepID=A0A6J8CHF4_MYTCO|nr:unnamed protein product [Mytilus coruscus]